MAIVRFARPKQGRGWYSSLVISLLLTALLPFASAAAQAADGLTFERPEGWERREDPRSKQLAYLPPNLPAGKDCAVLIFPAQKFDGTAQAYLDQLVQNATRGNQLQGDVQHVDVGSFRVAVLVQKTPQGITQVLAIHVARWGASAQAVLFASTDLEMFKTHGASVKAMIQKVAVPGAAAAAPAGAPASVAIAGLLVPLPKGWTRQEDPSGWVVVTPPAELNSANPRILISTQKVEAGGHRASHRTLLKALVEQAKWKGSYDMAATSEPGPFIATETLSTTDARSMKVFTALSAGDRMEVVVVTPYADEGFKQVLFEILSKTTLQNPPTAAKRPQVVEAYRRPAMKKFLNADGTYFYGSLKYDRMVFLSNGAVDYTMCHAEGLGAADLSKIDAQTQNAWFGSWREDGKNLVLRREAGKPEQVWERVNGKLRFGDEEWSPMPKIDGLRLKGRWSYKSDPRNKDLVFNYWIEFTEEGTFKTGGLMAWLAAGDLTGRAKPPEDASGTYEIREWTLFFNVGGRIVWSTDLTTLKDDPKDLDTLLINTYSFKRQ